MTDAVDLATRNAAAFWTSLARTRGHELVRRPGFLAVEGRGRAGLRALLLSPDPAPGEIAELSALVRLRSAGQAVVEDPYGSLDLSGLGLADRHLPVMIRDGAMETAAPAHEVVPVERVDQLGTAEEIVVHGFPLTAFQPYRAQEVFPEKLLGYEGVHLFLVKRDGVPAGACYTLDDGTVVGLYWVTTLPEQQSRGVGRALMNAVLRRFAGRPVTLSAAKAGKPLYDSLGFETVGTGTWWM
jgi:GNAT superfamily N-acetyltransferase